MKGKRAAAVKLAASVADVVERVAVQLGDEELQALRAELGRADSAAERELLRRDDTGAWT